MNYLLLFKTGTFARAVRCANNYTPCSYVPILISKFKGVHMGLLHIFPLINVTAVNEGLPAEDEAIYNLLIDVK